MASFQPLGGGADRPPPLKRNAPQDASGPSLAFTGVLGLAVVYALWQLRGGARECAGSVT